MSGRKVHSVAWGEVSASPYVPPLGHRREVVHDGAPHCEQRRVAGHRAVLDKNIDQAKTKN